MVLPANWLLMPHRGRWRVFIVVSSFVFYAGWDWRYTGLLAASILANQAFAVWVARATDEQARNRRTGFAVATNLAVLGWYKYAGFFAESAGGLFRAVGLGWELPIPNVVLPVGISFFTFQALSYVIDVRRERLRPVPLADFAVYLAFFPHLVAGPIVRAAELLPQLRHPRDPRRVPAGMAFWLIGAGLFKKVVVASYLADRIVDPLFAFPGQHGGIEALVGVYAYAIQIYADFSGYTDMAIGLALLLGFRFPQNFDAPYTASSLQDFWRRWHMTLSRWLRDYLYIPLGGSRGPRWRTYRNLLLTMLLGGLWHGAAWTFVVWGAIHGAGLGVERWLDERREARRTLLAALPVADHEPLPTGYGTVIVEPSPPVDDRGPLWVRRFVTFHVVCLAWVFFRANSIDAALDLLGRIAGATGTAALNPMVPLVVLAMLASQFVPADTVGRFRSRFASWGLPAQAAALAAVIVAVDALGPPGVSPFIYFQF